MIDVWLLIDCQCSLRMKSASFCKYDLIHEEILRRMTIWVAFFILSHLCLLIVRYLTWMILCMTKRLVFIGKTMRKLLRIENSCNLSVRIVGKTNKIDRLRSVFLLNCTRAMPYAPTFFFIFINNRWCNRNGDSASSACRVVHHSSVVFCFCFFGSFTRLLFNFRRNNSASFYQRVFLSINHNFAAVLCSDCGARDSIHHSFAFYQNNRAEQEHFFLPKPQHTQNIRHSAQWTNIFIDNL